MDHPLETTLPFRGDVRHVSLAGTPRAHDEEPKIFGETIMIEGITKYTKCTSNCTSMVTKFIFYLFVY